jgi:hypothetical protein
MTEPRQVTAVMEFRGGPGREAEAAEAWAFELTYYFTRGVGEPPLVSYDEAAGIYTCTGLIQTTHPGDGAVIREFWDDIRPRLDSILAEGRQRHLRELYPRRGIWFDGRDHPREEPAVDFPAGRKAVDHG